MTLCRMSTSTAFGNGRFVNRIPADRDVEDEEGNYLGSRDGYLCPECNFFECDRCDEKIYCDEDITARDVLEKTKTFLMVHIVSTKNV